MGEFEFDALVLLTDDSRLEHGLEGLQHVALHVVVSLFETRNDVSRIAHVDLSEEFGPRNNNGLDGLNGCSSHFPARIIIIILPSLISLEIRSPTCSLFSFFHLLVLMIIISVVGVVGNESLCKREDALQVLADFFGTLLDEVFEGGETGFSNFIVDIDALLSVERGGEVLEDGVDIVQEDRDFVAHCSGHVSETLDVGKRVCLVLGLLYLVQEKETHLLKLFSIQDDSKGSNAVSCLLSESSLVRSQLLWNDLHEVVLVHQTLVLEEQLSEVFEDVSQDLQTLLTHLDCGRGKTFE